MKNKLLIIALIIYSFIHGEIIVNEYSASNLNGYSDNYDKFEDWIELYNTSNLDIDIGGYFLSDNSENLTKWMLPIGTYISGNDFLIIWCSGRDEVLDNHFHSNFKLKQTKENQENIILSSSNGEIINQIPLHKTQLGHSYGRLSNNLESWRIFTNPTLEASNTGQNYERYAEKPQMSLEAGHHTGTQNLEIYSSEPISNIFYTVNGNKPLLSSNTYDGPIFITNTQVIKAVVISTNPDVLPSFIEFNTYFIDENHSLPIISSAANDFQILLNGDSGLRPHGTIEYFNEEGIRTDHGYGEYNKHGQDSWAFPQRSFDYIARDEMGYHHAVEEKLLSLSDRDEFQRLILRASGDDNYPGIDSSAHMRDIFIQKLANKNKLNLDMRRGERCVVYANGDFWGIYSIREKASDSDYTKYYYGQDKYSIQYVKNWGNTWAQYGGQEAIDAWFSLRDNIISTDLSNQNNYENIYNQLDITSLVDYVLINSFVVCTDWVNWNTSVWRGLDPNGSHQKWGLALWDEDATFNHYINYTGVPNEQPNAEPCYPEDIWQDPLGVIQILNKLRENSEFNQYYYTRYMDLLNTAFQEEEMISVLEGIESSIESDMPQHIARWGGSLDQWRNNVEKIKNFIRDRIEYFPEGLNSCYNLTGPYDLTIDTQPENSREIQVNSILIPSDSYPWTGKYHGGISMKLEVAEEIGFDYWIIDNSDINDFYSPEIEFRLAGDEDVTAIFSTNQYSELIINEINYNSNSNTDSGDWFEIYNPTSQALNISNYIFKDEDNDHQFAFPQGTSINPNDYLVVCKDSVQFTSQFPNITNLICGFDFGLSGNSDWVRIFNSEGILLDAVNYDDEEPWPSEADGNGATLELIEFSSDNALPESWSASNNYGTPGRINSTSIIGDINSDGEVNILDVVLIVHSILDEETDSYLDLNNDSVVNILDVIILINNILQLELIDDATFANYLFDAGSFKITSDGYIGAVQLKIRHNSNFDIILNDNTLISEYKTKGNSTIIVIVEPNEPELFKTNDSFYIQEILISNSQEIININIPFNYELTNPYPNPFNNVTNIKYSLPTNTHVTMKIFNLLGREIATILNQNIEAGYHNIAWDAKNHSSGVYFVKMITKNFIKTQKVVLLK
ncbi:MAG: hypothetical protein CMF96_06700 [Candidatus Marinimicrobia bacterium]|nr:hypothetical protein [Candidatus Neomarinimicrobiota bacterium]